MQNLQGYLKSKSKRNNPREIKTELEIGSIKPFEASKSSKSSSIKSRFSAARPISNHRNASSDLRPQSGVKLVKKLVSSNIVVKNESFHDLKPGHIYSDHNLMVMQYEPEVVRIQNVNFEKKLRPQSSMSMASVKLNQPNTSPTSKLASRHRNLNQDHVLNKIKSVRALKLIPNRGSLSILINKKQSDPSLQVTSKRQPSSVLDILKQTDN